MAAAAVAPSVPPPPQQRYQGVQKESAGYRLLSAMGWKEGEGLGASKQGIKTHIKVKKKFENFGVGALAGAEHAQNWTNGMLDFHRVLSNLSEVVSEHAKRRSGGSSSSSSSGSDSEEESDASDTEQQRRRKKQQQQQEEQQKGGKRKAAAAAASSGGCSSSSSEEEAEEEQQAPKRVRAATHIGRFKKREAAKMVKAYSEHDLAAILGADPFAAAAAAVPEVRAQQRAASSSGYDSDSESSEDEQQQQQQAAGKKAAGKKARKSAAAAEAAGQQQEQEAAAEPAPAATKPPMIVVRRPMLNSRPTQPPTPQESRQPGWWQVCFHRAEGPRGVGAGASNGAAKPAAITIHGFSEQDQTNLYNLAHDKATQGRVGLGRSSMPKKVAGARWEGKKTRITDSDDEDEEEGEEEGDAEGEPVAEAGFRRQRLQEVAGPAPGGVALEQEEGLVIIIPASKRHLLDRLPGCQQQQQQDAQQQQPAAAAAAAEPAGGKKAKKAKKAAKAAATAGAEAPAGASLAGIKWKKAVAAALKASGKQKLKLSKLHKAVVKEHGVPKAQRAAALEALTAFLQQSGGKYSLKDGVVRAAAA